ncbi:hypothetical protein GCM10010340_22180 [Streptomyces griseoloalbus]|nr:hypothetical protein GCM10010340_22180 [Streptomyces albaduncus]
MVTDAKSAYVTGLHAAVAVASVLHFALGILALRWLPKAETAQQASDSLVEEKADPVESTPR